MALSSPHFRSRASAGRNRRKSELTPIFIPRLSEWRDVMEQEAALAERLVRAKRWVWAGCYVVGFGSGLLVASMLRPAAPVMPAAAGKKTAAVKKAAAFKKAAGVKKAAPVKRAAPAFEAPVVRIREVKR